VARRRTRVAAATATDVVEPDPQAAQMLIDQVFDELLDELGEDGPAGDDHEAGHADEA